MRKGLAILLMNMLASELGYKIKFITASDEYANDTLLLNNNNGDMQRFSGCDKYEQAVAWLRKKI
ncbi:hypothetical protein [Dictyobacter formicarum]|uniref:Uncharacterized protein n=1 Tax=Dictyobacter formicarum TaxID=2778368 RepID=A0ABQ3VMB4_9CHLR|nr:hypothetical protein [Dictyobacter formicarum]GHO87365.1 hypothetical protein KSZ_53710 [Dictyobacter formicarum]